MPSDAHVGENAELYAAGALNERERAAVDAHVARCGQCLRRVGEAEETVLALERGIAVAPLPQADSPPVVAPLARRGVPAWWIPAAAAAALILGLLFGRAQRPAPNPATLAMIHSHFAHAQFAGAGPAAKAIYARDRSWYYVIVSGANRFGVYGIAAGHATYLGDTRRDGATGELFARVAQRFDRLDLRDGTRTVESAAIR